MIIDILSILPAVYMLFVIIIGGYLTITNKETYMEQQEGDCPIEFPQ